MRTPGLWIANITDNGSTVRSTDPRCAGAVVAICPIGYSSLSALGGSDYEVSVSEAASNARLVAAAPDLLATLSILADNCDDMRRQLENMKKRAMTAIADAKEGT